MSRVVVLGGTGAMGAAVTGLLRDRGHDAVAASRATGVDVSTGAGLDDALAGADTVVDCLNVVTMSKKAAVSFFAGAATHVSRAAASAEVGHIVCLSIVNVTDPGVRRATGYYAGKAAQEEVYAAGPVPLTLARTTAWFSLAETFLSQIRVGPVAVVPGMRLQPVHPSAAAAFVVDAVESGPATALAHRSAADSGPDVRQLAGPEVLDAAAMARAVASTRHPGVRVVRLPLPMAGLREGLLPRAGVPVDPRGFSDWLARP
jgi:uncharacterized protein YbjT (DUF2867 family)